MKFDVGSLAIASNSRKMRLKREIEKKIKGKSPLREKSRKEKEGKRVKLQWLSDNGELVVDKQVLLTFYIGNYVDDVLYDMVPMEAGHVLLRRPWQYDRDIVHNGVTNRYSFLHKGKKVVLSPLSPSEVCEDQIKMRLKRERENKIIGKISLREKSQKEKEGKRVTRKNKR